jgi:cysteine desulfurase
MIYLDWAASAPPDPHALDTAREVSSRHFANPSSPHAAGKAARDLLEAVRARLSALLGGGRIVFTSGATESNSSLLLALLGRKRGADSRTRVVRLVASSVEHASIYEQARLLENLGISCSFIAPDSLGLVDPLRVAESLDEDTALVSIMLVNNETGAIQRVSDTVRAVRAFSARSGRRILVHTDAAQGFCKIPFLPAELGVDAASLSGHKIGGPRGIGALWLSPDCRAEFLAAGGGQESGKRPGTENLGGACAMLAAAETRIARLPEELAAVRSKMGRLIRAVKEIPGAVFFPEGRGGVSAGEKTDPFSPFILSFGFPSIPGEVVVRVADSKGFLIGTGSACSSRKKSRTRVLESMGIRRETALSAVRVSIGPSTTEGDLDAFAGMLKEEVPALLAMSGKASPRGSRPETSRGRRA